MAGDFGELTSKLRWASHQLAVLNIAVNDYIGEEPYVAVVEDDSEAKCYRVHAKLQLPPPANLAHIVGDVLNSLHGSLDYLAWQLVLREGATPDERTEFPIIKTMNEDGSEPAVNIYKAPAGKRGRAPVIKDEAILTFLRCVQPYHDGDRADLHPLQVLRRLNRECKHRHPVVLVAASVMSSFPAVAALDETISLTNRRIEDGDEITMVAYADAPNGCPPEQASFSPEVSLEGVPSDAPALVPFLANLLTWVDQRIAMPFRLLF